MEELKEFVRNLNEAIINPLIAFLFALALIYFAWGLFVFVSNANNEEERDKGKRHMLWSIIGLFIMVGVFGLIQILINTFGLDVSENANEFLGPPAGS